MKNAYTLILYSLSALLSVPGAKADIVCLASFDYYQTQGTLTIQFSDNSTSGGDIDSWLWEFGNGDISHMQSPLYTYHHSGTYNVCLTITDSEGCENTYCDDVIVASTDSCQGDFDFLQLSETLLVNFTDESESQHPFISWHWQFGDGHTSNLQNPSHTYAHDGVYEVCLTVMDDHECQSVTCQFIVIDPVDDCQASFTYQEHGGPLSILFSDQSISNLPVVSWMWTFGDGQWSTMSNPQHTYAHSGTYNVCLTIISIHGDCTDTYCEDILIVAPDTCHALFSILQEPNHSTVHFQNHSTPDDGFVGYFWDFGDGNQSTEENPSHEYFHPGTYNVCLTITTIHGCQSSFCHEVVISQLIQCHASFLFHPIEHTTSGQFTDTSTSHDSIVSWHWDFGDGHTSEEPDPLHTYVHNGVYHVCLTISDHSGCQDTTCHDITIDSAMHSCQASYTFLFDSTGNVILFTNTSTGVDIHTTYFWDFGDGHTSHEQHPHHSFPHSGLYTVCLFMHDPVHDCHSHVCHHILYHENSDDPLPIQFATLPEYSKDQRREKINMLIYPNPATEKVALTFEILKTGEADVEIFDFMGNKIQRQRIPVYTGHNTTYVDTRNLKSGRYTIILNVEGDVQIQSLMIID